MPVALDASRGARSVRRRLSRVELLPRRRQPPGSRTIREFYPMRFRVASDGGDGDRPARSAVRGCVVRPGGWSRVRSVLFEVVAVAAGSCDGIRPEGFRPYHALCSVPGESPVMACSTRLAGGGSVLVRGGTGSAASRMSEGGRAESSARQSKPVLCSGWHLGTWGRRKGGRAIGPHP